MMRNAMSTNTKPIKRYIGLLGSISVAILGVILMPGIGTVSLSSAQSSEQGQIEEEHRQAVNSTAPSTDHNNTRKVAAGGGGPVSIVTWFIPQNVSIRVGDTVTWSNPTAVAEPHTVSFMKQKDYFANIESPYLIANGTQLTAVNPSEKNTEPLIIQGQNGTTNNVIIAANNRQSPVAIDAQNNIRYLPPNANYTMTGDELYLNSGIVWPESMIPPGAPPITSFSVKFTKAGTYDYICEFHPWMTGRVIVQ